MHTIFSLITLKIHSQHIIQMSSHILKIFRHYIRNKKKLQIFRRITIFFLIQEFIMFINFTWFIVHSKSWCFHLRRLALKQRMVGKRARQFTILTWIIIHLTFKTMVIETSLKVTIATKQGFEVSFILCKGYVPFSR